MKGNWLFTSIFPYFSVSYHLVLNDNITIYSTPSPTIKASMVRILALFVLFFGSLAVLAQTGWQRVPNFAKEILQTQIQQDGRIFYISRIHNPVTSKYTAEAGFFTASAGIVSTFQQSFPVADDITVSQDGPNRFIVTVVYRSWSGTGLDSAALYTISPSSPYMQKVGRFPGYNLSSNYVYYSYLNSDSATLFAGDTVRLLNRNTFQVLDRWLRNSFHPISFGSTPFRLTKDRFLFFTDQGNSVVKLAQYNRVTRTWSSVHYGLPSTTVVYPNFQRVQLQHFDTDSVVAVGYDRIILRGNKRTNTWREVELRTMGIDYITNVVVYGDTIVATCKTYTANSTFGNSEMLLYSTDHARTFLPVVPLPSSGIFRLDFAHGQTVVTQTRIMTSVRMFPITSLAQSHLPTNTPGHPNPTTTSYFIPFAQQDLWDQLGGEQYLEVKLVRADGKQFSQPATISHSGLSLSTSALAPGIYKAHYTIGSKQYSSSFVKQ